MWHFQTKPDVETWVRLQFVNEAFADLARRGTRVCLQFMNVAFPDLARRGGAMLSVCSL